MIHRAYPFCNGLITNYFTVGFALFLTHPQLSIISPSATLYSLIETAKANHMNPQEYLYRVFEKIPLIEAGDKAGLETLLPWNMETVSDT